MKTGDRVKVKVKKQIDTITGRKRLVVEWAGATVQAIHDAQELYPDKPEYMKNYKLKSRAPKKETKFPRGTKIYQVQIDGRDYCDNITEEDIATE